ncbi:hypothetical protein MKX64_15395 [Paenibacillus sp. FSL M8-0334]|uniref:hypothetical protein n=1 Tax=Paenibacillus sp. FSL M8-0334 TaxID=2921623 RepID=UPI0030FBB1CA
MSTMTPIKNQVSIAQIIKVLSISPQAIELIAQIEFLLQTHEERSRFLYEAMGKDGKEICKILSNIRREKIIQNQISLQDFVTECKYDELKAIENLLQERLTEAKYNKLKQTGITPINLFKVHKRNPFARVMNLILFA